MKILIVDNNTKHLEEIKMAMPGHQLEVLRYKPGVTFDTTGFDQVVLSGGSGFGENNGNGQAWFIDEIEFIKSNKLPLIGICMGYELICVAYGETLTRHESEIRGFKPVEMASDINFSGPKLVSQFEAHKYGVTGILSNNFDILAKSVDCIEAVKHKTLSIAGVQFHAEVNGGTLSPDEWFKWLFMQVGQNE